MYNNSSVFAVNFQAKALCAQKAATERHRFIVGTCSLHETNEISILQYSEESNHIESVSLYLHPDQIWALEASPRDPSLIVTSRQAFDKSKALSLWKMDKQTEEDINYASSLYANDTLDLHELDSFNHTDKIAAVESLRWHNTEEKVLSFDGRVLTSWQIAEDKVSSQGAAIISKADSSEVESEDTSMLFDGSPGAATWDPHNATVCAVGCGRHLNIVDTRAMEVTSRREYAHRSDIRDVDFNPNRPMTLITAGEDRAVRFWDLRKLSTSLITLRGHSHWVYSARYNPYHDQLVLTGGSDQMVNLWRVASVSSSPWLGEGGEGEVGDDDPPDVKVRAMDQHEDSVHSVAWSAAEAWIYCSLSYDGRAIVNHVPSTEKYKILL